MTGWLIFALVCAILLPVGGESRGGLGAAAFAWALVVLGLAFTVLVSAKGWP